MQYTQTGNTSVIKIEQDEEVMKTVTEFCIEHGIENAYFTGIGAVKNVSCGYYDLPEHKYYFTSYPEIVEVVSMTGNTMLKDGTPFLHVHAVFTDQTNTAFGGHVEHMTVGVTLEVMLTKLDTQIARELEPEIGLALMQCGG